MSEDFAAALDDTFAEPEWSAIAASLFLELRELDGLEYLEKFDPDMLADHISRFAAGGTLRTGWNKWCAVQQRSGVDTSEYRL
jgi:hypothetical protein